MPVFAIVAGFRGREWWRDGNLVGQYVTDKAVCLAKSTQAFQKLQQIKPSCLPQCLIGFACEMWFPCHSWIKEFRAQKKTTTTTTTMR